MQSFGIALVSFFFFFFCLLPKPSKLIVCLYIMKRSTPKASAALLLFIAATPLVFCTSISFSSSLASVSFHKGTGWAKGRELSSVKPGIRKRCYSSPVPQVFLSMLCEAREVEVEEAAKSINCGY